MLKKLRKKETAKKVWIILGILIIPAFLLWGLGSAVRSPKESPYAGKIFGKSISSLEYQDALAAVRNQFIMQLGNEDFYQLEKYLNLPDRAWDRLVLLYEAKRRKISVTDREVIELIEGYSFFQRNGKFDARIYEQALRYFFHTSARLFEEQSRQNLALSKLYKQVTASLSLSEDEIKKEYQKFNEEISVYYIRGDPSDFVKDITPTEENLKDYFSKNSWQFKQPPSFNLEYVTFALENTDEEITKDKIKNFLSHLKKSQDFLKIAKEYKLQAKETGFFSQTDPIPGIGWSGELQNLLVKLKIDQIVGPVHMDKYYYILRLKEKKEPYIPDFESIKDKVKEAFIKDESVRTAKEKIENCLKRLKEKYQLDPKSVDFNQTAKDYGLKSDSTASFKYGSYIEGIGTSDNFWTIASGLKEDGFSEVISLASRFYIIKLKSKTSVDEKKYEAQKTEFAEKLLAKTKEEYFHKFLQDLKKSALALRY